MKKMKALILVSLFTFTVAQAQSKFALFGGVAMPLGEYAAQELEGEGGYAKLGSTFGLQLDFFSPSNIGFGVLMGSHRNAFDDAAFGQDLMQEQGYSSAETYANGTYRSFYVMPVFGYKFVDRNAFTWDIMGGLGAALNSMSQPVEIKLTKSKQPEEHIFVDFSGRYSFALNLGTRFIYYVSPSLGFSFAVNYYSSNPEYTIVRQDFSDYNDPEPLSTKLFKNRSNILSLTVGVAFGK